MRNLFAFKTITGQVVVCALIVAFVGAGLGGFLGVEWTHHELDGGAIAAGSLLLFGIPALAYYVGVSLGGPIGKVSSALHSMSTGDLTVRIPPTGSGEIRAMVAAYNSAAESVLFPIDSMMQDIQVLSASAEALRKLSGRMSHAAEMTVTQTSATASASEEFSKGTQTVSAGMEEMSASIKEIARNSSAAAKVAGDAVKLSKQASDTMTRLGEGSDEIGKVVKLITAIAGQTNLLALNASIEAAGAGEAGKGFAVVANEVKELAKEAAKATDEISRKIEGMQAGTKGALEAISQIGVVIGQISDITNTIASAIEEQTVTTSEITRNIGEAAKGSADISQSIVKIAKASESATIGVGEAVKLADSLNKMVEGLKKMTARFKC